MTRNKVSSRLYEYSTRTVIRTLPPAVMMSSQIAGIRVPVYCTVLDSAGTVRVLYALILTTSTADCHKQKSLCDEGLFSHRFNRTCPSTGRPQGRQRTVGNYHRPVWGQGQPEPVLSPASRGCGCLSAIHWNLDDTIGHVRRWSIN